MRLVAGVSAAHFVSHFYMLVLPPLFAFVRADYGVSYTEIGPGADRVQRRVGRRCRRRRAS